MKKFISHICGQQVDIVSVNVGLSISGDSTGTDESAHINGVYN